MYYILSSYLCNNLGLAKGYGSLIAIMSYILSPASTPANNSTALPEALCPANLFLNFSSGTKQRPQGKRGLSTLSPNEYKRISLL